MLKAGNTGTVNGGIENDSIDNGGTDIGSMLLLGSDGADTIFAESSSAQTIVGGNDSTDGADCIVTGSGADLVFGNGGNDNIILTASDADPASCRIRRFTTRFSPDPDRRKRQALFVSRQLVMLVCPGKQIHRLAEDEIVTTAHPCSAWRSRIPATQSLAGDEGNDAARRNVTTCGLRRDILSFSAEQLQNSGSMSKPIVSGHPELAPSRGVEIEPTPPEPPILVESIGTTNIVRYNGSYISVPQAAGSIDLASADLSTIPGLTIDATLRDARRRARGILGTVYATLQDARRRARGIFGAVMKLEQVNIFRGTDSCTSKYN